MPHDYAWSDECSVHLSNKSRLFGFKKIIVIILGGYQTTPFDVAFDRTFDFLLSNFSTRKFDWPLGGWTLKVRVKGLQNITRDCPIITYETRPKRDPGTHYFTRVCVAASEIEFNIDKIGFLKQVSTVNSLDQSIYAKI